MIASVLAVAGPSPASAVELPAGEAAWDAATGLPPMSGSGGTSASLDTSAVRPPVCADDLCVSTTTRPELRATIDPDPEEGYEFAVFDLAGEGGLTSAVTSVSGHDSATWAPQPGLLRHGRAYAWTVTSGDETQDWDVFVVDVQRHVDQGTDHVGPIGTTMSTGELVIEHPLGSPDDDHPLNVDYRSTDRAGRSAGSTPFNVVSDGWTLSGAAIGGASWYAIDSFANGATIVARAVDGTSLRYERNGDGDYDPPTIEGRDVRFMYPALDRRADGTFVISETDGSISTFTSDGVLDAFEVPAREGGAGVALDVEWAGGLLRAVSDRTTGRTSTFTYLGDRACRVSGGFDAGSPHPALCAVTTLAGETIELRYLNGRLSRIIGAGGAVTDVGYNDSGAPTAVRESLAADSIAAGLIADDDTAVWTIDYDGAGRVAEVTSPEPQPGHEPLRRIYSYADGVTTIADNGGRRGTVTFDPDDYRILRLDSTAADGVFTPLYDDQLRPRGHVDERGLQTSWLTDDDGNVTDVWGPAPPEWFDETGRPHPAHADRIATSLTTYGAGAGMIAVFSESTDASGPQTAQTLLTSSTIDRLPGAVDTSGGWRMTAIGDAMLPLAGDVEWRFTSVDHADPDITRLVVDDVTIAPGEVATIPVPDDAEEIVPVAFWLIYGSSQAPTPASPASFAIEYRGEGEQDWATVDPAAMVGLDLPTTATSFDVYAAGSGAVPTMSSMSYANELLGLVGSYTTDAGTSTIDYEPADPGAGHFARPLAVTNTGGVTSTIAYWGPNDTARHPITDEQLPQSGRIREVRTGTDVARGMIYDVAGRVVAYTADGVVTSAIEYDERGRVTTIERRDEPGRSTGYHHGAGGDPRVTGTTLTIGEETFTTITTIDLLGRVVTEIDPFGTTATSTHDASGSLVELAFTAADGATSTTTYTHDADDRQLREVAVEAADGTTYSARITGYDQAGRATGVAYSNGMSLAIDHDPVNGMVAAHRWSDGVGGTWTDTVERTSQTGRILTHTLLHPGGEAAYTYGYDSATGALTDAALVGSGDGPTSTTWSYDYDAGARAQRVTATADATVTLDYTYDANQAPTQVVETTAITDGETVVRDIPLVRHGADITTFDTTELTYDTEGLVVRASDGETTIELVRDALGTVLGQAISTPAGTTNHNYSGPFAIDEHGVTTTESIVFPGAATVIVPVTDDGASWSVKTLVGDTWWTAGADGAPSGSPVHYSPDGERLTEDRVDPTGVDAPLGWRSGHAGLSLELDTTVTVFGARAYIPTLGLMTTTDPIPGAGPTPYSYADNDPINLVDPTGNKSEGPFDDWDSWGTQLVVTIGLTFLAALAGFAGAPGVATVLLILLAGYFAALSASAFMDGDYVGGSFYAVSAVLTLGGVRGYRAHIARTAVRRASVVSHVSHLSTVRTPSASLSSGMSTPGSIWSMGSGSGQSLTGAQQQMLFAALNLGRSGHSVGMSLTAKAALYGAMTGSFFGVGWANTFLDAR